MKTKKIVNHEIKTQKFNENAKRMKKSHCGMARAFVQISENGPQSKKFGHTWIKPILNLKLAFSFLIRFSVLKKK